MKIRYPLLRRLPFLLPIFWLVRLASALLDKENLKSEMKTVNSATDAEKSQFVEFLERNGL
jgi:hypothetical protein